MIVCWTPKGNGVEIFGDGFVGCGGQGEGTMMLLRALPHPREVYRAVATFY